MSDFQDNPQINNAGTDKQGSTGASYASQPQGAGDDQAWQGNPVTTGGPTDSVTGSGYPQETYPNQSSGTGAQPGSTGGNGDALDKGVDFLERKAGHEQSHSTTEKMSDGLRKGFTKMTGRDVPVKDQTYS